MPVRGHLVEGIGEEEEACPADTRGAMKSAVFLIHTFILFSRDGVGVL